MGEDEARERAEAGSRLIRVPKVFAGSRLMPTISSESGSAVERTATAIAKGKMLGRR